MFTLYIIRKVIDVGRQEHLVYFRWLKNPGTSLLVNPGEPGLLYVNYWIYKAIVSATTLDLTSIYTMPSTWDKRKKNCHWAVQSIRR